ncbi:hypothetical protein CYMTET_2592 [Cymbomonas tetramitiformis]|uniref:Uncharacterized protein n=1 Tax=Cymbomonas tetramitiformis TaxID=36881 RepID=A0AAE0H4H1_9CHLO|nr:hypothetical protein CYMTET_2770 [Cymbomonas tetramitiformis]KAK3289989.1 hypothetical protein CYMTET_2592 [Cymbomonas tetramitiformis]
MVLSKVDIFNNHRKESKEEDNMSEGEDITSEQDEIESNEEEDEVMSEDNHVNNELSSQDCDDNESLPLDTDTEEEEEEEYKEVKELPPVSKPIGDPEYAVLKDGTFKEVYCLRKEVLVKLYPEMEEFTQNNWHDLRLIYGMDRVRFDEEICFSKSLFETHEEEYELSVLTQQVGG